MMKLILATLAACAFAAQDTTPPVISLTLSGVSPDHRAVGGVWSGYSTRRAYHKVNTTIDYSTSAATECVVKSLVADCPEPVCEAHDHHDSSVKCNEPMLFQIYQHEGAKTPLKKVFDTRAKGQDFIQCDHSFDPDTSGTNCIDTKQRDYMAQWLLTYTASDASDNHAEHVTFSFVFVDLFAPSFDFRKDRDIDYKWGFAEHETWGDIDGRFTGNLRDHEYEPFNGNKTFGRFCAPNDDNCKDSGGEASSTKWATYDGNFDSSEFNLGSKAKIKSTHYELVAGNLDVERYGALQTGSSSDYNALLGRKSKKHTQYHMRHHAIAVDVDRPSDVSDYTDEVPTVYWRQNGATTNTGAPKWSSGDTADLDTLTVAGTSVVVMDFTVTDNTGRFGFEGSDNKNLHRLEFHFSDAIAPKIYLACYKSSFAMNNESTADGLGGNSSLGIHYANVYADPERRQFGRGVVAGADGCTTRSCAQKHAQATCSDKVNGAIDICADADSDTAHACKWEDPNDEIVLECGSDYTHTNNRVIDAYQEPGAYLIDNVDSWDENLIDVDYRQPQKVDKQFTEGGHLNIEYNELDSSGAATPLTGGAADMKTDKETRYTVKYTGSDAAGLAAAPVTRNVKVVDRSAPRITLVGDHTIQNSAGSDTQTLQGYNPKFEDEACESEPVGDDGKHVEGCFNHEDYKKRGYLCKDECTSTANLQTTAQLYQFHPDFDGEGGSACDEAGHNVLAKTDTNDRKELTGDWAFPEYRTGIYAIVYTCKDEAGNSATVCRTINNVDHTKPIIQILGSDKMQLEATHQGNYIDDGATCSDQVDGVISQNVEVSGDVVNLSKVGTYTIMYNCKDAANRPAVQAVRTVVVSQTSCPTCAMECYSSVGKEVIGSEEVERNPKDAKGNPIPQLVNDAGEVVDSGYTGKRYYCIQPHEASFQYTDAGATCSDVIDGNTEVKCQLSFDGNEDTSLSTCDRELVKANKIGTYVITYKSENSVGKSNDERSCRGGFTEYVRSVLVQDTLRPVITLKYDGKKVAQGTEEAPESALGHGQTHNADFAAKAAHNERLDQTGKNHSNVHYTEDSALEQGDVWAPELGADDPDALMAEEATTSGVNGWVLGAIASAVTGLALLGYSQRKTTVATSVPV